MNKYDNNSRLCRFNCYSIFNKGLKILHKYIEKVLRLCDSSWGEAPIWCCKIYFSLLNLRVRTYLLLYIIVNIFIFWFENYVKDYPPFSQLDQVEGGVGWREMEVGWGREGGVAVMGLKGKLISCNVTLSNSSLSLIFSSDQRRRLCKIL